MARQPTKKELAEFETMTPAQLLERFIVESKLIETIPDEKEANRHVYLYMAVAAAIKARGGTASLAPLMKNPDPMIAYSAAQEVAQLPEFREEGLAVLDRIAEEKLGFVSSQARTSSNFIKFGNRFGDPVEYEKTLAEIRSRMKSSRA